MRAKGNGEPQVCLHNLLQMRRGEVRLDCLRGLPSDVFDRAATIAEPAVREAVRMCAETYEPRLSAEEIHEVRDNG